VQIFPDITHLSCALMLEDETKDTTPLREGDRKMEDDEEMQQQIRERRTEEAMEPEVGGRTYSANHLTVLLKPVCVTMVLTAMCVVHIRTDEIESSMSQGLSSYTYYDENQEETQTESSGEIFGKALLNALIMICGVIVMTFGIVALFYFRCYKTLAGVIMFTTVVALGYNFGFMLMNAIDIYDIVIDYVTFIFFLYNFAVVGVIAIFYKKGTPTYIGQMYLIVVSVTIAYLLSFLAEWTGWVLLVVLAFYDLCAVLTPCGPLKALVEMAQERNDGIPGLLYEAHVDSDIRDDPDVSQSRHVHTVVESGRASPAVRAVEEAPLANRTEDSLVETNRLRGVAAPPRRVGDTKRDEPDRPSRDTVARGHRQNDEDDDDDNAWDNSVKLGLGDFIFYSLLVSKAALMGFLPFATCFISIVEGLVMTMLMLAVIQAALPALPFSMLLGVACFFFSYYVLEPKYIYPLQSNGVLA